MFSVSLTLFQRCYRAFLTASAHVYLDAVQPLLEERQHLGELVVRVHVVHGTAALLQQPDDVLVLDLLVHLELLESGAQ